jgi:hypothetical protein
MSLERKARMYAAHLALIVRGGKGSFELRERYERKRLIGRYRSAKTLYRGLERYNARLLSEIEGRLK